MTSEEELTFTESILNEILQIYPTCTCDTLCFASERLHFPWENAMQIRVHGRFKDRFLKHFAMRTFCGFCIICLAFE